jgi:hypothetical protein
VYGKADIFGCNVSANLYSGGMYIAQLGKISFVLFFLLFNNKLDLNANCQKSIVIHAAATPLLMADAATGHLYFYANGVVGNATFGTHTFPSVGADSSAVFIAQLSWVGKYN